ncbi:hypothetical protein D9758_002437 [Tetrapyrgos nigripes]|uniref:Heterokaryon incompatibility domain-containing protein n=1 Tax=Tetrapyrgos nigripes TaxID=182062 RepID=A0A8H5LT17_9AGAR|nr:hypothetical protein D9758_002437 [Tetrapyrgos nigripes]
MRLLNTKTLKLREFYFDIPTYAILSHTWDKEEVTLQDMQDPQTAKSKAGYAKLSGACAHARKYNFEWIWIDSCCINKESSAELSENINSMYGYYGDSEVCYVYLSDASSAEDPRDVGSGFRRSRWFKRGWTLQELLAPRYVVFLGKDWEEIGTRWSLRDAISALTHIPSRVFEDGDMMRYSIAQKMSWAAFRETTRPEDQAYCLMGLFGVNMPPLYGEGSVKAFMRLQQEIIKVSDDCSIFAWIAPIGEQGLRGLFAKSPFEFRMSGEVATSKTDTIDEISSYTFTNNGLHIHLPLERLGDDSRDHGLFLASLHCQSHKDGKYLSVYLRKINGRQYVRCRADQLALTSAPPAPNSLQDLIVKENNYIPSFTRRQERDAEKVVVSVKLPDTVTRNRLVFDGSQNIKALSTFSRSPLVFDGSQDIKGLSTFSIAKWSSLLLKYRVCSPSGTSQTSLVLTLLRTQDNLLSLEVADGNPRRGLSGYVGWTCYGLADTIILPLGNGDLVSFRYRNTGKCTEKILEMIYLSQGDALTALKRELTPPAAGFIVPVTTPAVSLQRTSSFDFFDMDCGPDQQYLAFQASTFRILTYTVAEWLQAETFDVALGFRGVVPWVHISFRGQKFEVDGQEWDLAAYLDFVSQRTDHWPEELQTSSMTLYLPDLFLHVKVTIEARTTIQLGSHLLRIDFTRTEISE